MKFANNILFNSLCMAGFIFLFSAHIALAQDNSTTAKCNPTSCSCGGSLLAGSCSVRDCCKPNVAYCKCDFFSSACNCGEQGSTTQIAPIPPIYEQNILEFASLLNSAAFTSTISKSIANKLPVLITSAHNNNSALYYETSVELDALSRSLPAGEKQNANSWIASKGGTVFLE